MFIFILVSGVGFSIHLLLFPVIVLIQFILTLGINFILSSVTVFINDIAHFVPCQLMTQQKLLCQIYRINFSLCF